jgi:hypothetical protein
VTFRLGSSRRSKADAKAAHTASDNADPEKKNKRHQTKKKTKSQS